MLGIIGERRFFAVYWCNAMSVFGCEESEVVVAKKGVCHDEGENAQVGNAMCTALGEVSWGYLILARWKLERQGPPF